MQTELRNRQRWRTRLELAEAIFEYPEIFHNRQRRHSAPGMLTPVTYELRTPILKAVAKTMHGRVGRTPHARQLLPRGGL